MTTNNTGSVISNAVKREVKATPGGNMQIMLRQMEKEIAAALPSMVTSERFQRVALTAFNSNPKLQQCDVKSFLAAMMTSAQLGLEPNTPLGECYLIPYGTIVQFQLGLQGTLELAQRSEMYKGIYAHKVCRNDDFKIEYGMDQILTHTPHFADRGDVIGYYAVYKLINGGQAFVYMTKDEVIAHAKQYSKTFGSGPWQTSFDAMAKKTVLKQLMKYAPKSVEMKRALNTDETVKSSIARDMDLVEADEVIDLQITSSNVVDMETGEVKERLFDK